MIFNVRGLISTACQIVNQALMLDHGHSHEDNGHHHGVDMDYPVLALSVTVMSISIKEGYDLWVHFGNYYLIKPVLQKKSLSCLIIIPNFSQL